MIDASFNLIRDDGTTQFNCFEPLILLVETLITTPIKAP